MLLLAIALVQILPWHVCFPLRSLRVLRTLCFCPTSRPSNRQQQKLALPRTDPAQKGFVLTFLDCRIGAHEARAKRSEEHTSELQSLMRISYAVFCLKKQNKQTA